MDLAYDFQLKGNQDLILTGLPKPGAIPKFTTCLKRLYSYC